MVCKYCEIEFIPKRETAKYCSDNCRVKAYNKREGKTSKPTLQMQVVLNEMREIASEMRNIVSTKGLINIQDLTNTTNPVSSISELNPIQKTVINSTSKQAYLSNIDSYKEELKECRTIPEIEKVVKIAKMDVALSSREKIEIENYGKDLSKDMYLD